jgi:hypothetical protein
LKQTSDHLPAPVCEGFRWKGRDATRLANGVVELISILGGGHLASFKLLGQEGRLSQNVLWEAPWITRDPLDKWSGDLSRLYGSEEIGKFLASYTGHALCLDYFGAPAAKSASLGLSLHGEAAIRQWKTVSSADSEKAHCGWRVSLPVTQLTFEREIRLGEGESVAYVRETVSNECDSEHHCDWVQHVTFGPPFLRGGESTLAASAQRGISWPSAYESSSLLAADREFFWPWAPREASDEFIDLRQPFSVKGSGYIAGMQLDTRRHTEFILAINWNSRLGVGYCFRRCDFSWMTLWEENHTRQNAPWNGMTAACGMEFGTTPLPLGEQELQQRVRVFDSPTGCIIPARGTKTAKYLIFLFAIPSHIHSIQNVAAIGDVIVLDDEHGDTVLSIPANQCEAFLAESHDEARVD